MRDSWIWSVSLGRWWNVRVRLHMFFLLFAVLALYLIDVQYVGQPTWLGVGCIVTLLASVLLHEIGHVIVARRLGGHPEEIVIGPFGGLSAIRVPYEPHSELVALIAGPLVNASLCLAAAIGLTLVSNEGLTGLLNPFAPELRDTMVRDMVTGAEYTRPLPPYVVALNLVFWLNWVLVLVNLIPTFPFDGGRALRALLTFFWPELDAQQSLFTVSRLAKVTAAALLVAACLIVNKYQTALVPPWLVLAMLAIFVFFFARREELQLMSEAESNDDQVFGYDFSQGYTSLERGMEPEENELPTTSVSQMGVIQRWIEKRRRTRQLRLQQQEAEDEKRVDEILGRLHEHGMHSLSRHDRELLHRVSQRYRSRPS